LPGERLKSWGHHLANYLSSLRFKTFARGSIDSFLQDLPPEVGCEVIDSGISLTGGGALIPGVKNCLEQRTGIATNVAINPRAAVVEGARAIVPVVLFLNQWK
jgi:rod shape-determining protein MreB